MLFLLWLWLALAGTLSPMRAQSLDTTPPEGAVVLFDGSGTAAWVRTPDGRVPVRWPILEDGTLEVAAGTGDIQTASGFGDFRLHLEFWLPATPEEWPAQGRSNSGIYLQDRYEIQVLDSYGRPPGSRDTAAAIYSQKAPDMQAALPPETWQTYDVDFRAARFDGPGGARSEDARVTLWWNGVLVHDDVALPGPTPGGVPETPDPGPIRLQDHADPVRFRNIWAVPLDTPAPGAAGE